MKIKPLVEKARKKYSERVPVYVYDTQSKAGANLAAKYNAKYVPTLIFLRRNGTVASTKVGSMSQAEIEKQLSAIGK